MADQEIVIRFKAVITELVSGLKGATSATTETTQKMSASLQGLNTQQKVSVDSQRGLSEAVTQSMRPMGEATAVIKTAATAQQGLTTAITASVTPVKDATSSMADGLGSMSAATKSLITASIGAGVVGAAMYALKAAFDYVLKSMDDVYKLADSFRNLEYATGATTKQLNTYAAAMELSGGTIADVDGLLTGMARSIKANGEKLIANGVAADKAALMAMPFEEYLSRVYKLTEEMATPNERLLMLQLAFGRGAALSGDKLKDFNENLKEGSKITSEYAIVTEKSLKQQDESELAIGRLTLAQKRYAVAVSDTTTPIMNWWRNLRTEILNTQTLADDIFTTLTAIFTLNPSGIVSKYAAALAAKKPETDTGFGTMEPGRERGPEKRSFKDDEDIEATKAAAAAAKEVAEKVAAEETALRASALKSQFDAEVKHRSNIKKARDEQRKAADAERTADLKEIADTQREAAHEATAMIVDEYSQKRMLVGQDLAMGKISKAQELAALRALYAEEQGLLLRQLEAERNAATEGSLERVRAENKVIDAKRKSTMELRKLDHGVLLDSKTQWIGFTSSLTSSWSATVKGLVNGTTTWGKAFKQVQQSITDSFIDMGMKMVTDWLKKQVMMTLFHQTQKAAQLVTETTTAAASKAITSATGLVQIGTAAALGGANAASTAAQTPFIGWSMAIPAGLAVMAAIMGMKGGIGGAAGGYRVPSTINPITQLHRGEHVLPSELAQKYERGATGGGGLTVNINGAMDSQSIEQHLRAQGPRYTSMLRLQARRGSLGRKA